MLSNLPVMQVMASLALFHGTYYAHAEFVGTAPLPSTSLTAYPQLLLVDIQCSVTQKSALLATLAAEAVSRATIFFVTAEFGVNRLAKH